MKHHLIFILALGLPFSGAAQDSSKSVRQELLDSVTVTETRPALSTTTSVSALSGDELDQLKGHSLAEITHHLPGVNMLQTGAGIAKPVIHGLHSNRILLLNNGIRQEGQQWGSEHAPEIDPFIAKRITVIKGAEAIRFGADAMGGVIIVEPPSLEHSPGINGEVQLAAGENGRSGAVSASLGGGLAKLPGWGWRLQGTLRQAGNFQTADYFLENTGLKEANFSAAAGYAKEAFDSEVYFSHFNTEIGIFSGAHIGNLTDLEARIKNGRPLDDGAFSYEIGVPRQQISHDLLKVKGSLRLSPANKLQLQYGFQRNRRREYDLRRGGRSGIPSMDFTISTQTLDAWWESFSRGKWKTQLGLNGLIQVNNTATGTFATPLIPNFDSYGTGVYAIQKFIQPKYELEAGLRYDYKFLDAKGYDRDLNLYGGKHRFHNLSASLGGLWRPSKAWEFRSNMGLAWRPPSVNELYSNGLHHGTASYERGDSSMVSERGYKWINTASYQTGRLSLTLDGYLHWFDHFIYLKPAGEFISTMQGTFPTFDYTQNNARFAGLDFNGHYHITRELSYQLKASMVRAKNTDEESDLPWIPADRISNGIGWEGSFGQSKQPLLHFGVEHEYVARQTRYEEGSDFAPPPPGYQLWHAEAGAEWQLGGHALHLHIAVQNLGNKLYRSYMNRLRYYAHDTGRNIFIRLSYKI